MSNITLPKSYVRDRCRAIIKTIETERDAAVREAFDDALRTYYAPPWFQGPWFFRILTLPLDLLVHVTAWYRRLRHGWPPERPVGNKEDLDNFATYYLSDEERAARRYKYAQQYNTCCLLLHAATITESEESMQLSLQDYERIADAKHQYMETINA